MNYIDEMIAIDLKKIKGKIKEQKNEISILKSLIDNYRDAESKLFDENHKLKQRITELESKEMEKPTKYTTVIIAKEINGQTYVQLEDFMSVVNDLQAQIGT